MKGWDPVRYPEKDATFYENGMEAALSEARRICMPTGIGTVVLATRRLPAGRHRCPLCRAQDGSSRDLGLLTRNGAVGSERCTPPLSRRRFISSVGHAETMMIRFRGSRRLARCTGGVAQPDPRVDATPCKEGVVGADAIFACLGPALEIYSRYSRVETASGEVIPLGDQTDATGKVLTRGYLSYVWEAVAKEALSMIFAGARREGFEPDGRLTAMWLWTLSTGGNGTAGEETDEDDEG